MAVVVTGMEALQANLRNVAHRSSRGAREELEQGAIDIRDLARLYAPVDKGALEESILLGSEIHGFTEKQNGRNVYTVEVDMSMPDGHGKGVVGDYAEEMHEGFYNLGDLSEAKQDELPGITVGRKFLERAMEVMDDEIKRKVEAKVSQGIGH